MSQETTTTTLLLQQTLERLKRLESTVDEQNIRIQNLEQQNKQFEETNRQLLAQVFAVSTATGNNNTLSQPSLSTPGSNTASGIQGLLHSLTTRMNSAEFAYKLLLTEAPFAHQAITKELQHRFESSASFEDGLEYLDYVAKFLLNGDRLRMKKVFNCDEILKLQVIKAITERGDVEEALRCRDTIRSVLDVTITLNSSDIHRTYWSFLLFHIPGPSKPELAGEYLETVLSPANDLVSKGEREKFSFNADNEKSLKSSLAHWMKDRATSPDRLRHIAQMMNMFFNQTGKCTNGLLARLAVDNSAMNFSGIPEKSLEVLSEVEFVRSVEIESTSSTNALRSVLTLPNLQTILIKKSSSPTSTSTHFITREWFQVIRDVGSLSLRQISVSANVIQSLTAQDLLPLRDAKQTTIPNLEQLNCLSWNFTQSALTASNPNDFKGVSLGRAQEDMVLVGITANQV